MKIRQKISKLSKSFAEKLHKKKGKIAPKNYPPLYISLTLAHLCIKAIILKMVVPFRIVLVVIFAFAGVVASRATKYQKGYLTKTDFVLLETTMAPEGRPQCSMKCNSHDDNCQAFVYEETDGACKLGTFHPINLICPVEGQMDDIYGNCTGCD